MTDASMQAKRSKNCWIRRPLWPILLLGFGGILSEVHIQIVDVRALRDRRLGYRS